MNLLIKKIKYDVTVVDLEDFEIFVDENGGFKDSDDHMVDLEGNEECKD